MWEGVRTEEQKKARRLSTDWFKSTGNTRKTTQGPSDSMHLQMRKTLVCVLFKVQWPSSVNFQGKNWMTPLCNWLRSSSTRPPSTRSRGMLRSNSRIRSALSEALWVSSLGSLSSVESKWSILQSRFSSTQPREEGTTKQLCKLEILFPSDCIIDYQYVHVKKAPVKYLK